MEVKTKYDAGAYGWTILNNSLTHSLITEVMISVKAGSYMGGTQTKIEYRLGEHGVVPENKIFETRQDLIQSL